MKNSVVAAKVFDGLLFDPVVKLLDLTFYPVGLSAAEVRLLVSLVVHDLLLFAKHLETAWHVPFFLLSAQIKAQDLVLATFNILHVISPKSANFVHMLKRQLSVEICKFLVKLVYNLIVFIIRVFRLGCLI